MGTSCIMGTLSLFYDEHFTLYSMNELLYRNECAWKGERNMKYWILYCIIYLFILFTICYKNSI